MCSDDYDFPFPAVGRDADQKKTHKEEKGEQQ